MALVDVANDAELVDSNGDKQGTRVADFALGSHGSGNRLSAPSSSSSIGQTWTTVMTPNKLGDAGMAVSPL